MYKRQRVNNVPVEVEFNFTKRLEGRELKANEFSFVLKDSEGKTLETVSNDASGNVKFSKLEFKKGQEGVHNYTVEEAVSYTHLDVYKRQEYDCLFRQQCRRPLVQNYPENLRR